MAKKKVGGKRFPKRCPGCRTMLKSVYHAGVHYKQHPSHQPERSAKQRKRRQEDRGVVTTLPTVKKKSSKTHALKFCTDCGNKRGRNWSFCGFCGGKF